MWPSGKGAAVRQNLCLALGVLGGAISTLFGGWSGAMTTLLICMAVDYLTGMVLAGVFRRSGKTESGALSSAAGLKGLTRKGMILLILLISARLDLLLETHFIRDGVCIAFLVNELISILENAGAMGVPIPPPLERAIDLLRRKGE